MRVLLFVLHVCMLRECAGAMVTTMLVCGAGGGVVAVSAECEYGRYTLFMFCVYCRRRAIDACGAWGERFRRSMCLAG